MKPFSLILMIVAMLALADPSQAVAQARVRKTPATLQVRMIRSAPLGVSCSRTHCFLFGIIGRTQLRFQLHSLQMQTLQAQEQARLQAQLQAQAQAQVQESQMQLLRVIAMDRLFESRLQSAIQSLANRDRDRNVLRFEILQAVRDSAWQRRAQEQNDLLRLLLRGRGGFDRGFPSRFTQAERLSGVVEPLRFLVQISPAPTEKLKLEQSDPSKPPGCGCPNCRCGQGIISITINGIPYKAPHVEEQVIPNPPPSTNPPSTNPPPTNQPPTSQINNYTHRRPRVQDGPVKTWATRRGR